MAAYTNRELGGSARITTHLDRRSAIEGCDHVINMIQVGGFEATKLDFDIPAAHGLRQTIGDTLGIGGIFRALRTIPVMLEIGREMDELRPGGVVSQLHQPDGDAVLGDLRRAARSSGWWGCVTRSRTPPTSWPSWWGCRSRTCRFWAAGSTTRRSSCGSSATARICIRCSTDVIANDPELQRRVRVEMYRRYGYFPTESSEHGAEYLPWVMRSDEAIERYRILVGDYIERSVENLEFYEEMKRQLEAGEPIEIERSQEYASLIIHSILTGQERVIYGNVRNGGLISNLPSAGVRRGAVPGGQKRRSADRDRRLAAAAGGAQPHVSERVRADGHGRAGAQP